LNQARGLQQKVNRIGRKVQTVAERIFKKCDARRRLKVAAD